MLYQPSENFRASVISTGSGEPKCSTTKLGVLERICEDDWFKRPDILLLLKKIQQKLQYKKTILNLFS